MLDHQTLSVFIDRDWREVYEAIWRPETLPAWASGLSSGNLRRDGAVWTAQGPDGPIHIRFSPHSEYGVMDHVVEADDRLLAQVPMRVFANGAGAQVMIVLFRQPDMSDAAYARDAQWVQRDLAALQAMFDAGELP